MRILPVVIRRESGHVLPNGEGASPERVAACVVRVEASRGPVVGGRDERAALAGLPVKCVELDPRQVGIEGQLRILGAVGRTGGRAGEDSGSGAGSGRRWANREDP